MENCVCKVNVLFYVGIKSIHSRIRASGMRVQRSKVRSIVTNVRGEQGLVENSCVPAYIQCPRLVTYVAY